ncbi:hypothetical protein Y032_0008g235 [Ancylostoma ceylanicum]|nr:hypothetical protein Y032_0008g235 [Ancylostoma ceylanicum]
MDEPFNKVYARIASDYGIDVHPADIASCFPKYMKDLSHNHPCFGFGSIGHFEWWKRIVIGCLQEQTNFCGLRLLALRSLYETQSG